MAGDASPSGAGFTTGRIAVVVLLIAFLGVVGWRYYQKTGWTLFKGKEYTNVPKELQVNYVPSEFKIDLNDADAMAIITNPERYQNEFNQLVYDINVSTIQHVVKRMGLSNSLERQAVQLYRDQHHGYLKDLFFNDFITLKDTTSALYQSWYNNESTNATTLLREVASKYTCFMVNQVISTLLQTKEGMIYARGKKVDTPCGIALNEAIAPLMKRLEDRAAIEDFGRSRGILQEKIERTIAELATLEIRDKKGISRQKETKVWGFSVSSSDIDISAISILKVGCKLDQHFEMKLNEKTGMVTVVLPEPTILTHEVYPRVDKMDIGWMREVESEDLNKSFNLLRAEFRREALESGALNKSKQQVTELMNTLVGPLLKSVNRTYKLQVQFINTGNPNTGNPNTDKKPLDR